MWALALGPYAGGAGGAAPRWCCLILSINRIIHEIIHDVMYDVMYARMLNGPGFALVGGGGPLPIPLGIPRYG